MKIKLKILVVTDLQPNKFRKTNVKKWEMTQKTQRDTFTCMHSRISMNAVINEYNDYNSQMIPQYLHIFVMNDKNIADETF